MPRWSRRPASPFLDAHGHERVEHLEGRSQLVDLRRTARGAGSPARPRPGSHRNLTATGGDHGSLSRPTGYGRRGRSTSSGWVAAVERTGRGRCRAGPRAPPRTPGRRPRSTARSPAAGLRSRRARRPLTRRSVGLRSSGDGLGARRRDEGPSGEQPHQRVVGERRVVGVGDCGRAASRTSTGSRAGCSASAPTAVVGQPRVEQDQPGSPGVGRRARAAPLSGATSATAASRASTSASWDRSTRCGRSGRPGSGGRSSCSRVALVRGSHIGHAGGRDRSTAARPSHSAHRPRRKGLAEPATRRGQIGHRRAAALRPRAADCGSARARTAAGTSTGPGWKPPDRARLRRRRRVERPEGAVGDGARAIARLGAPPRDARSAGEHLRPDRVGPQPRQRLVVVVVHREVEGHPHVVEAHVADVGERPVEGRRQRRGGDARKTLGARPAQAQHVDGHVGHGTRPPSSRSCASSCRPTSFETPAALTSVRRVLRTSSVAAVRAAGSASRPPPPACPAGPPPARARRGRGRPQRHTC